MKTARKTSLIATFSVVSCAPLGHRGFSTKEADRVDLRTTITKRKAQSGVISPSHRRRREATRIMIGTVGKGNRSSFSHAKVSIALFSWRAFWARRHHLAAGKTSFHRAEPEHQLLSDDIIPCRKKPERTFAKRPMMKGGRAGLTVTCSRSEL